MEILDLEKLGPGILVLATPGLVIMLVLAIPTLAMAMPILDLVTLVGQATLVVAMVALAIQVVRATPTRAILETATPDLETLALEIAIQVQGTLGLAVQALATQAQETRGQTNQPLFPIQWLLALKLCTAPPTATF